MPYVIYLGEYWIVKNPSRWKLNGLADEQRINGGDKRAFTIEI